MPFLLTQEDFQWLPANCCPKCFDARAATGAACAKCGVVFAKVDPATLAPPAWLLEEWATLCGTWASAEAHERLRARAFEQHDMQPLTRMYRLHLLRNPGDERAEVALKSIARAATALVMGASYQVTQRKERHRAAQEGWRKYLRWLLRLFGIPL